MSWSRIYIMVIAVQVAVVLLLVLLQEVYA